MPSVVSELLVAADEPLVRKRAAQLLMDGDKVDGRRFGDGMEAAVSQDRDGSPQIQSLAARARGRGSMIGAMSDM